MHKIKKNNKWTSHQTTGLQPSELNTHTCINYNNSIYIFCGLDDLDASTLLFHYDLKKRHWKALRCTGEIPEGRFGNSTCVYNNFMFIIGGVDVDQKEMFYKLDLMSLEWRRMNWPFELGTSFQSSVVYEDLLIICGKRLWIFDLIDERWIEKNGCDYSRSGHSAVVYKDKMFCFGGKNDQQVYFNDLWSLDLEKYEWTRMKRNYGDIPSKRAFHSAVVHDDKMYIVGGSYYETSYIGKHVKQFSKVLYNDVYEYHFGLQQWRRIDLALGSRLFLHTCIKSGNSMILFGGKKKWDTDVLEVVLPVLPSQMHLIEFLESSDFGDVEFLMPG